MTQGQHDPDGAWKLGVPWGFIALTLALMALGVGLVYWSNAKAAGLR